MRSIFFAFKEEAYFLAHCGCVCVYTSQCVCSSRALSAQECAPALCMIILWADFRRLACYLDGLWRYSLWVQQRLWHQRNSLKPRRKLFYTTTQGKRELEREKKNAFFIPEEGLESREWWAIWGIVLAKSNRNVSPKPPGLCKSTREC